MKIDIYIYKYTIYTYTGRTFLQCARKGPVLGLLQFSLLHTLIYLTGTIAFFASEISGIYSTQRNGPGVGKCWQRPQKSKLIAMNVIDRMCFSLEARFSHKVPSNIMLCCYMSVEDAKILHMVIHLLSSQALQLSHQGVYGLPSDVPWLLRCWGLLKILVFLWMHKPMLLVCRNLYLQMPCDGYLVSSSI